MTYRCAVSHDRLLELLDYNPQTGVFVWKKSPRNTVKSGSIAGSINTGGYRNIAIDGILYRSNRLAWFYVNKEWPSKRVDHKNLDKSDDSIWNFREATQSQNKANGSGYRTRKSNFKGAYQQKGRWTSSIRVDGRLIYLGMFPNEEEAGKAYAAAAVRYFGEFARSGGCL